MGYVPIPDDVKRAAKVLRRAARVAEKEYARQVGEMRAMGLDGYGTKGRGILREELDLVGEAIAGEDGRAAIERVAQRERGPFAFHLSPGMFWPAHILWGYLMARVIVDERAV